MAGAQKLHPASRQSSAYQNCGKRTKTGRKDKHSPIEDKKSIKISVTDEINSFLQRAKPFLHNHCKRTAES